MSTCSVTLINGICDGYIGIVIGVIIGNFLIYWRIR